VDRVEDVGAVIHEADGTFSVIRRLRPDATPLWDIPELGGSTETNRLTNE
jgi:hypothetical protein